MATERAKRPHLSVKEGGFGGGGVGGLGCFGGCGVVVCFCGFVRGGYFWFCWVGVFWVGVGGGGGLVGWFFLLGGVFCLVMLGFVFFFEFLFW